MSDLSNQRWNATLEKRGADAVRELLRVSPGTGAGAVVSGLGDDVKDMPTRGYVEQWIAWREAEQRARQEQRDAKRDWWARGIAIAAALLSALAWLFPRK